MRILTLCIIIMILSTMLYPVESALKPDKSLVLWFTFDDGKGEVAKDSSKQGTMVRSKANLSGRNQSIKATKQLCSSKMMWMSEHLLFCLTASKIIPLICGCQLIFPVMNNLCFLKKKSIQPTKACITVSTPAEQLEWVFMATTLIQRSVL